MLNDRRSITTLLAVTAIIYVAARFWRLTDSCLWFDEIFSVHAAEHEWGSMLLFVARDLIHPPLFYLLLKVWISIAGESLISLRLLPVIFACLALVPFYLLCKELKIQKPAIALATFLFAINGTFIKYAQLLRMYSMLMFLSLLSVWLFARFFYRGKNLTALIIVNALMIYTHYYGWLVVDCEVLAVLIFQRFKWRGMAVMTGILSIFFAPWLWFVYRASQSGSELNQNIGWIPKPGFAGIGTYIIDLIEPFYFQASSAEPASIYAISIPLLLILAAATAIFLTRFRGFEQFDKQRIYFLSTFVFVPIILVFIASWILPNSIWGTRHLIIIAGPIVILAAIALADFDKGWLRITAITLIFLFSGYAFVQQAVDPPPFFIWCAWEGVANDIPTGTDARPTKVYTFENLVAYHVWFASRNSKGIEISAIKGVDGMHEDESYFLPRGFDDVRRRALTDITDERAWLVFRTEERGQETPLFQYLRNAGYVFCPNAPARFGKTDVYRIEIVKSRVTCSP
jgi:uncharacterized membrane protein